MNSGLFTSNSEEWETPQAVFDRQNKMFGFELDVCATPQNAKCTRFYTKEQDGLKQPWASRNWMNPPYGRNIGKWCARASAEGGGRGTLQLGFFQPAQIRCGSMNTAPSGTTRFLSVV